MSRFLRRARHALGRPAAWLGPRVGLRWRITIGFGAGALILALALDILNRRTVTPAEYVKHPLVTPETVETFYPNARLIQMSGGIGCMAEL
jgi:hypothetical protein